VLDADVTATALPVQVKIAPIVANQTQFRLESRSPSIQAGSLIETSGTRWFGMVDRTDGDGFVYLRGPFQNRSGNPIRSGSEIDPSTTTVQSLDFRLTIKDGAKTLDDVPGLSLDPFHTGYLFGKTFSSVRLVQSKPPITTVLSYLRPVSPKSPLTPGK